MSTNTSQFIPSKRSSDLTSYDFLKAFAVVLMIVDHVGLIFFPDEVWFRILGRLCVPIWFFLIGYARTAEIPKSMWIGGGIIVLSSILTGQYIFPLNILFTLIAARALRGWLSAHAFHSPETLRGMFLILAFASIPTVMVTEYGSLGFLFVVIGTMMRHWQEIIQRITQKYLILYIIMSFITFWLLQGALATEINAPQITVLTLGLLFVGLLLFWFKPETYPRLTKMVTPLGAALLKFMGRRTLEIYVFHIVLFRMVAMVLYPDRFPFMELKIIAENMMAPIL